MREGGREGGSDGAGIQMKGDRYKQLMSLFGSCARPRTGTV